MSFPSNSQMEQKFKPRYAIAGTGKSVFDILRITHIAGYTLCIFLSKELSPIRLK